MKKKLWILMILMAAVAMLGFGTAAADGLEIVRTKPQKETILVKNADIPVPRNSHQLFADRMNGLVTEDKPWEIGRSALALCCAINESSETKAAAVPKNRAVRTTKKSSARKKTDGKNKG